MTKGFIHGHTAPSAGGRTPTYRSWQNMVARCSQPSNPAFRAYKKRGITLCARWREFENFLADMGERPPGSYTLDRINNDSNYEPGNCRWATKREQANNRSTNVIFEYRGRNLTFAQLVLETGVSKDILRSRLLRGKGGPWTVEDAVLTPTRKGHRTDLLGPMAARK